MKISLTKTIKGVLHPIGVLPVSYKDPPACSTSKNGCWGVKPKKIQVDNGSEFISKEVDRWAYAIVSDNQRAVVTKAHKYAPVINKTFQDFARHYDCVIDPARPYHPQDKALVERSVTLVYQRIYYPLSKHTFFSLEDLNHAIMDRLTASAHRLNLLDKSLRK